MAFPCARTGDQKVATRLQATPSQGWHTQSSRLFLLGFRIATVSTSRPPTRPHVPLGCLCCPEALRATWRDHHKKPGLCQTGRNCKRHVPEFRANCSKPVPNRFSCEKGLQNCLSCPRGSA